MNIKDDFILSERDSLGLSDERKGQGGLRKRSATQRVSPG
jgi:hypothetical protein